jgi:two-component system, cell cycle response regulator
LSDNDSTGTKPILNLLDRAGSSNPTLTVLAGGDSIGRCVVLDLEELIIGRSIEAHIRIDDDGVSRSHARVLVNDGKVVIEDLQSKNGTLVNGVRVVTATLASGDKIQLGPATILRFAYQDFLEAEAQKKLFDQATRDVLTGVYNRTFLTETLVKEFAFANRHGHSLSALMIDVDRFKSVNDSWGHAGGDYVLKTIAEVLQETLRVEDVLGRYGGEEFVVVARELTLGKSIALADRLRQLVERHPFLIGRNKLSVTVSIGIATTKKGKFDSWQALVDAADKNLYEAKAGGRNRVVPPPTPSAPAAKTK